MQEMTMVERVARAIYEASPFRDTAGEYDEQSEIYRRMCRLFAVAAIESMREPSTRQLAAAQTAWLNDPERKSSTIYTAMIDSALSE